MKVVVYHNARCSKSRATCDLLSSKKVDVEIVEYLKSPLSYSELEELLKKLDIKPNGLIRFGESIAKELGITKKDIKTDEQWINLMVENPVLIERPIVVKGDKAAIGRPIENIEKLLNS